MEIDNRFPTKLSSISDAPEPLRGALVANLPSGEPTRLLIHAPAFGVGDEKTPATVLAVTSNGWLVVSETDTGTAGVEKSNFRDTLYLELKSILLWGQLRICFAAVDKSHSVAIRFETVEDECYREAIDLILAGIDPALTGAVGKGRSEESTLGTWPMKIRNEAQRYWPRGQQFVAAVHWQQATFGGDQKRLVPGGALLATERELVVIAEEEEFLGERPSQVSTLEESKAIFAGVITFVPRVWIRDFHVSHRDGLAVLALQVHSAHGGEELNITFPSDDEPAVSKAMEQMFPSRGSAK
jgi:hypothetical protein